MPQIKNTNQRYGIVSISLHWFMAALIFVLIGLGLYMVDLPDEGFDMKKITLIVVHKELGMLVLFLVLIRLVWRIGSVMPLLPPHVPSWQKLAARCVHLSFYGFMIALPLTGWLMSSAGGFPVAILGLFTLPDLIEPNIYQMDFFIEIHNWLAYGLIGTIFIHIIAALMHQFIYKDDILKRIWF
ncbi:MAG TPA: cytochrome b [Alphaproteobacteria bacterium]|nr:cytochrome b [Alphaproteobacteria bacterium]